MYRFIQTGTVYKGQSIDYRASLRATEKLIELHDPIPFVTWNGNRFNTHLKFIIAILVWIHKIREYNISIYVWDFLNDKHKQPRNM